MKKLIISQNKHWKNLYEDLYEREALKTIIKRLELPQIEAVQGIRRSGKSTIFKLLINYLSKKTDPQEILFLNLDDPFFIPYANEPAKLHEIIESAEQITGKKIKYLFLDEVQSINGWERYVKSAYDNQYFKKIFVTGSNATFLDTKLTKLLSGRYFSTKIFPLSFKEILKIEKIGSTLQIYENRAKILSIIDDILQNGSFVEVYQAKEDFKRDIIKSYFETIILKDCIYNYNIRDTKSFKALSYYLISNFTSPYSYYSLSKAIKIGDMSIKEYISFLEDSFLLYEIKHFSYSLKEQNSSKKKVYLSDNGFALLNFSFSKNHGRALENLVFSELLKAGYEIYFYNKNSIECDFIVRKEEITKAIQVCYELNEKNIKRELNGLKKLPFACDEKIVITYKQNLTIENINALPFWDYFGIISTK